MKADEMLRSFERAQRRRGLRERTIVDRSRTLTRLARTGPLMKMSTEDLEDWLDRQDITLRSRRAYLSHMSSFYSWAVITKLRIDDPTTPIVPPKVPRKMPRPIGDADLEVALSMANPRMRAWLSLACYEGFRCMEISKLERADVLDRHTPPLIKVVDGKGGKEGVVPLHPLVAEALDAYGLPDSGPVFLSSRGRPYAPATISGYIADFLHGLGLHDTAHRLRDWFGTAVYASTHDLRLTQEMMRHSDPSSTAGYVAFDNPSAVEAVTTLAVAGMPTSTDLD